MNNTKYDNYLEMSGENEWVDDKDVMNWCILKEKWFIN